MAITAMNSREIIETPANATACPDIVVGAAAADAGDPLDRHLAKPAAVFAFREDETDTAKSLGDDFAHKSWPLVVR
jgi:hypothetical protein